MVIAARGLKGNTSSIASKSQSFDNVITRRSCSQTISQTSRVDAAAVSLAEIQAVTHAAAVERFARGGQRLGTNPTFPAPDMKLDRRGRRLIFARSPPSVSQLKKGIRASLASGSTRKPAGGDAAPSGGAGARHRAKLQAAASSCARQATESRCVFIGLSSPISKPGFLI